MPPSSPRQRRSVQTAQRTSRGFLEKYYPKADGKRRPAGDAKDPNDLIRSEFLVAYYQLNRCYAHLLDIRKGKGAKTAKRQRNERSALQDIEKGLRCRDELEDRYAPYGVIAEPVMENGFTVDVKFTFGSVNASGRLRSNQVESSASVPIALPSGIRIEDLTFPDEKTRREFTK